MRSGRIHGLRSESGLHMPGSRRRCAGWAGDGLGRPGRSAPGPGPGDRHTGGAAAPAATGVEQPDDTPAATCPGCGSRPVPAGPSRTGSGCPRGCCRPGARAADGPAAVGPRYRATARKQRRGNSRLHQGPLATSPESIRPAFGRCGSAPGRAGRGRPRPRAAARIHLHQCATFGSPVKRASRSGPVQRIGRSAPGRPPAATAGLLLPRRPATAVAHRSRGAGARPSGSGFLTPATVEL